MTTSWSTLTTPDLAHRRAAGRRRYNALRKAAALSRRAEVKRLAVKYGWRHGLNKRIADELGVDRSTVSRDMRWLMGIPQPTRAAIRQESAAGWVGNLEPLGARLAAQGCECEETDDLHHRLGHVLKFAAETLDADEDGKLQLGEEDRALMKRVRDVLVGLI